MSLESMQKKLKKSTTDIVQESPSINSIMTVRLSKLSFMDNYRNEIRSALNMRRMLKVTEDVDGQKVDFTPKFITLPNEDDEFERLFQRVLNYQMEGRITKAKPSHKSSLRLGVMKTSMTDIIQGIGSSRIKLDVTSAETEALAHAPELNQHTLPFIKVTLRLSDCLLLYEQQSTTEIRHSEEGVVVDIDNKIYDYMTVGKGKIRRRSDVETQTQDILYKSRDMNTIRSATDSKGTYVSFYEMFDTYKAIEADEKPSVVDPDADQQPDTTEVAKVSTTLMTKGEQFAAITKLPSFIYSSMIIKRLLASNVYEDSIRRFRNMNLPDRLALTVDYRYRVRPLFVFRPQMLGAERKAVADMSFCKKNGDILAVAYGIYSFSAMHVPKSGHVCVWSIKNPDDPERIYQYTVPAVSVQFSPYMPKLLAIGLYDGSVEVRDITNPNDPPVAISLRGSLPGCEPVVAIKWIRQSETGDAAEIDPFLALSQNGTVTRFRLISSPYLLGFKQMELERVDGMPEGLPLKFNDSLDHQLACQKPQGLNLTTHPLYQDIYYVLTDEGCLHKCSTNYQHQYLEVLRTHDGSVTVMDFSPWSPKLFLTCGNDWSIRIWMEGIFNPLITLVNHLVPVHAAYWSRTNSTVIVTLNRKTVDIWDLRRNVLQPMSSTPIQTSFNTLGKFSSCGRIFVVGNERGNLHVCALDNMPFPPHFQYDELEKAIFAAVSSFPDILNELKSIGFFGFPDKQCVIQQ